jgi:hypothetical protein
LTDTITVSLCSPSSSVTLICTVLSASMATPALLELEVVDRIIARSSKSASVCKDHAMRARL